MSQAFEEVIRIKLEQAGVENAEALIQAFTDIARSGQLTEDQLSGLTEEFSAITTALRDTSAAQAAAKSLQTLTALQADLRTAMEATTQELRDTQQAERASLATYEERKRATEAAKTALREYTASLDANKSGIAEHKKAVQAAAGEEKVFHNFRIIQVAGNPREEASRSSRHESERRGRFQF